MIKDLLIIIPARKNSKRIKDKNLKKIKSEELFVNTIKFALSIKLTKDIIFSTDSNKMLKISNSIFKNKIINHDRKNKYSSDNSKINNLITSILGEFSFNEKSHKNILLLQPTSPFRSIATFNKFYNFYVKKNLKSLISVYQINNSKKNIITYEKKNFSFLNKNKVDLFQANGSLYIIKMVEFSLIKKFISNKTGIFIFDNYKENIDIDNIEDINLAKKFI